MKLIAAIWIALITTPEALLVGCAVMEAFLMITRPQLSWLLPAPVMLASGLIQRGFGLLWPSAGLYWSYAFTGTTIGAALGAVMSWFYVPEKSIQPEVPLFDPAHPAEQDPERPAQHRREYKRD